MVGKEIIIKIANFTVQRLLEIVIEGQIHQFAMPCHGIVIEIIIINPESVNTPRSVKMPNTKPDVEAAMFPPQA